MFAELLGTFFLVLVAAGAGMVNARFGGHAIGTTAQVAVALGWLRQPGPLSYEVPTTPEQARPAGSEPLNPPNPTESPDDGE